MWEKLIKITEEVDEFMSSKNRNEFSLNLNKNFCDALKGFKPLKSMRTRRSRIAKIKKSKVIEKKSNDAINLNQYPFSHGSNDVIIDMNNTLN